MCCRRLAKTFRTKVFQRREKRFSPKNRFRCNVFFEGDFENRRKFWPVCGRRRAKNAKKCSKVKKNDFSSIIKCAGLWSAFKTMEIRFPKGALVARLKGTLVTMLTDAVWKDTLRLGCLLCPSGGAQLRSGATFLVWTC